MNDLLRSHAPISDAAWAAIEEEAKRTLKLTLAARKLVDFRGPLGWDASAISSGRTRRLDTGPGPGIEARMREVQPLVELRVPIELSREELESVGRGAAGSSRVTPPSTQPLAVPGVAALTWTVSAWPAAGSKSKLITCWPSTAAPAPTGAPPGT